MIISLNLEENEQYFIVPINKKYAIFTFKPYKQMKDILECLRIPFKTSSDGSIIKHKRKIKPSPGTMYNINKYTINLDTKRKSVFFFKSDLIDKVLDYYKIDYIKEKR